MGTRTRLTALVAVLFCAAALPAGAATLEPLTLDEMALKAELIVIGRVSGVQMTWSLGREKVLTFVTLTDLETLQGAVADDTIVLRQQGGSLPGFNVKVAGAPEFDEGRRLLLFVRGNYRSCCPIVGLNQGMFILKDSPDGDAVWLQNYKSQYLKPIGDDGEIEVFQNEPRARARATLAAARARIEAVLADGQRSRAVYSYTQTVIDLDYQPPPPLVPPEPPAEPETGEGEPVAEDEGLIIVEEADTVEADESDGGEVP